MAHSRTGETGETGDAQFEEFLWDIDLTARRPRASGAASKRSARTPAAAPAPVPQRAQAPVETPAPALAPQALPPHLENTGRTQPRYRSAQPAAPSAASDRRTRGRGRFYRPELETNWQRISRNLWLRVLAGTILASGTTYLVVVALTR